LAEEFEDLAPFEGLEPNKSSKLIPLVVGFTGACVGAAESKLNKSSIEFFVGTDLVAGFDCSFEGFAAGLAVAYGSLTTGLGCFAGTFFCCVGQSSPSLSSSPLASSPSSVEYSDPPSDSYPSEPSEPSEVV